MSSRKETSTATWVKRWKYWVSAKPIAPGIYRLKEGGHLIRSGNTTRVLPASTRAEAVAARSSLSSAKVSLPLWSDFAVSLFEERVLAGEIESAATRERWSKTLEHTLIPAIGHLTVDEVTPEHINGIKMQLARWIRKGRPSIRHPGTFTSLEASTANGYLRLLSTICRSMTARFRLPTNPYGDTSFFREKSKYSIANPNSLPPNKLREFLELASTKYPQHFALLVLGFVTGRRPSELRALKKIDIAWRTSVLVVRRSHTRGQELKAGTKTGVDVTVFLPESVLAILKDHIAALPPGVMRDSPFLFPSRTGNIRSRSGLDKPFLALRKALGLGHKLTPRAMRRSFQDLARAAAVEGLVGRSISGHKTEKMQEHYSTVGAAEQRTSLERMVKLVQ